MKELLKASSHFSHINEFAFAGIDIHHKDKIDAPSGTAKALSQASQRDIPFTSIRFGSEIGTHQVMLDSPFEKIQLTHEAKTRDVFAYGAIRSAKWLLGKKGNFTFEDFILDAHHSFSYPFSK